MSVRKKELCDSCQKEKIEPFIEGAYLGDYLGNKTDKIHVCENCYRSKEKEYLENYAFIYSYLSRRIEEGGNDTGYIKVDDAACYAHKKDDAGKVLRQKDCSHCQPWKQKGSKKILAKKLKEILNSPEYVAVPDLPDYNSYYNKFLFNGKEIVLSSQEIDNNSELNAVRNYLQENNKSNLSQRDLDALLSNNSIQWPSSSGENNLGKIVIGIGVVLIVGFFVNLLFKSKRVKKH